MDHLISAKRPDLVIVNKKKKKKKRKEKRICRIVDFVIPADHSVKLKESEKREKYLDHARKLKRLWNMKVTVIPLVIGVLVRVTKGLVQELEYFEIRGRVETIQTKAY